MSKGLGVMNYVFACVMLVFDATDKAHVNDYAVRTHSIAVACLFALFAIYWTISARPTPASRPHE